MRFLGAIATNPWCLSTRHGSHSCQFDGRGQHAPERLKCSE